jgi:hypothetical protein
MQRRGDGDASYSVQSLCLPRTHCIFICFGPINVSAQALIGWDVEKNSPK